jgi:hypothetical protein
MDGKLLPKLLPNDRIGSSSRLEPIRFPYRGNPN